MSSTHHVNISDPIPSAVPSTTWTTERVELLRSYVTAGLTCLQIAQEIGVSRNAVIGKLNRLGLKGPPRARSHDSRGRRPRGPGAFSQRRLLRAIYAEPPFAAGATEPAVVSANPCTLLELNCRTCRWPIGEADAKDFTFCGNSVVAGLSYCAGHARMAYRPSTPPAGVASSPD
jgi:GcrA cell cycle regulator